MINTRAGILIAGLMLWTGGALAAESCYIVESGMNRFRAPEYSAPVMWRANVGNKDIEHFSDAVLLDDQSVIAGGYHAKPDTPDAVRPYLARIERRGKILWQVRGDGESNDRIVSLIRQGDKIVTLNAAIAKKTDQAFIRVMRYDLDGKNLGGFALSERDGTLVPVAIAATNDGYYVAAQYANTRSKDQHFGVVYKVDEEGQRIWRRAYMPGLRTTLEGMTVLKSGELLLAGFITAGDGRQSGWLVRADAQGGLKWQHSYPRGRAGLISRVAELPNGDYITGGTLWPIGGERTAAWLMQVNPSGERVWERTYVGADDNRTVDLAALEDGRTMMLVSSVPIRGVEQGQYAHARVMAHSPRGELQDADSYAEGYGLWPTRLLNVNGLPLVVGRAQEIPPDPPALKDGEKAPPTPPTSYDGWVAELQNLPSYDDPCVPR